MYTLQKYIIEHLKCICVFSAYAFSALTLLVECQEEHLACNKMSDECLGYLSGARWKWFVYGPADASATPSSLASVGSRLV